MNTKIKITKAVYEPLSNRLVFYAGEKPQLGFVGNIAHSKMMQVLSNPEIELIFKDSEDMENAKLIKQMHAIMAAKGLMDMKPDILAMYEVKSSKELTHEQLHAIVSYLKGADSEEDLRHNRSVVLYWLGKLGVKGSKQDGWDDVNNYLQQPRIAGKVLYQMSVKELHETTARLRMIYNKNQNKSEHINRLKTLN
ncbi:MAG: hypothetical protein PHY85_10275 [Bacteroidales bacterium]|nr:hypothetical protein [Bacteroidales bacterium]